MKKLLAVLALVSVCGIVRAQDFGNATFGKLSGNEIQASKITIKGVQPMTNATATVALTLQTVAVTNAAGTVSQCVTGATGVVTITAQR
ncbi:MAG: hypothetical protein WCS52_01970 [bacterium]